MMKLFTMSCAAMAAAGTAGEELAFEQLTVAQKMAEGAITLVLGMGTVFVFLVIMIGAMNLTSVIMPILNKFMPEEVEQSKSSAKKQVKDNDAEIALAIACAIRERGRA